MMAYSTGFSFFFFPPLPVPEVAVCVCARAAVCVCGPLCSPQSPVAVGAKSLHQRPVCLSAQCQGKYLWFVCFLPASFLQHVSVKCSVRMWKQIAPKRLESHSDV